MLEEAARLTQLVESLLLISRADAGQIRLERSKVALFPFVREVASLLEVLADEKHQSISVEGDDATTVEADPVILRQVLINLFDNAIKYSPVGDSIQIRVFAASDQTVGVEVQDSGPGITPEHRERVFDRFYRVDPGRSRSSGGAGLGLSIARWGAEAHGGRLELESPERGGAIFRLVLRASNPEQSFRQISANLQVAATPHGL
jgi:signal transduction histidine kinase